MSVRVIDLSDQILDKTRANEFLYSIYTGEEYSANRGDYWSLPDDYVFTDSEGNEMILATRKTSINIIKGE